MSLRPSSKTEARRSLYKVAVEGRRHREEEIVKVGKDRREETLQNKRSQPQAQCLTQKQFLASVRSASANYKKLDYLPDMVTGAWSDDVNMQLKAATEFRQLLSIGDEGWSSMIKAVTINEVIKAGVVPRFVQFLEREDFPQLQFEATWVLTNIASGTPDDTKVVIDNGALPVFVKLLRSPNDHVREQAVWALGNVAGDTPATRDLVLSHDALLPLLAQLNVNENTSMLRTVTWALTNICRGIPHLPFEQVKVVLPALSRVMHSNDREVLANICSILYCICNGSDMSNQIQAVIDAGLCPRVVKLLLYPHPVLYPALQTVNNFVCGGNDMQVRYIIDLQVLPYFFYLLTTSNSKVIKMIVCYIISRLTSNKEFIQDVMEAGIVPPLLSLLRNAESKVMKLAAHAITNAILFGSSEQVKFFATERCVQPLCNLLSHGNPVTVVTCLNGIEAILEAGEAEKKKQGSSNPYVRIVCDCEGFERMENLHDHENVEVYDKAMKILETYWPGNEDDHRD